jgi:hypothetical protein
MRKRILAGGPYSDEDREAILDYCQTDVDALAQLLPRLIESRQNLAPALWRAEFMKALALAEWHGVPIDANTCAKARSSLAFLVLASMTYRYGDWIV